MTTVIFLTIYDIQRFTIIPLFFYHYLDATFFILDIVLLQLLYSTVILLKEAGLEDKIIF